MTDPIYTDQDCVELFRRAVVQCDQSAREVVRQRFGEVVLGWLRRHPSREAACRLGNEEQYVTQALAQFWQMSAQQQVEFQTLADVLRYLRASLNEVVLDALRTSARQGEMLLEEPGDAGGQGQEQLSRMRAVRCGKCYEESCLAGENNDWRTCSFIVASSRGRLYVAVQGNSAMCKTSILCAAA